MQINKYFNFKKLLEHRQEYQIIYDFLLSKNINLSNVFIVNTPAFLAYYTENNMVLSKNIVVNDILIENVDFSIFSDKYQVIIFPFEDVYNKMDIPLTDRYEERLRLYYELNYWGEKVFIRKNKMKRIYG